MTFTINKITKTVVGTGVSRERDTMHDLKPEMDIISAIVCFRVTSYEPSAKLSGKVLQNPFAKFPLTESAIRTLNEILFGPTDSQLQV